MDAVLAAQTQATILYFDVALADATAALLDH
jgi:hypothetical protein